MGEGGPALVVPAEAKSDGIGEADEGNRERETSLIAAAAGGEQKARREQGNQGDENRGTVQHEAVFLGRDAEYERRLTQGPDGHEIRRGEAPEAAIRRRV